MLHQLAPFALVLFIWLATAILVRAWWAQREDLGVNARLRESMARHAARRAALDAVARAGAAPSPLTRSALRRRRVVRRRSIHVLHPGTA